MSALLTREKDIFDSLGRTVTLEFTRDSPLFRQNIMAFEDSFSHLSAYCREVLTTFSEFDESLRQLEASQSKLAAALTGQSLSRSLFTNSLPNLAELSASLRIMSTTLLAMNNSYAELRTEIKQKVCPVFEELAQEDLTLEKKAKKEMETLYSSYEALLDNSLQKRMKLTDAQKENIVQTRVSYETSRFDLVQRLNTLDCNKKLKISKAVNELCKSHYKCHKTKAIDDAKDYFATLEEQIIVADDIMELNADLWAGVRARLEGEIQGALPPPGSPLGETIAWIKSINSSIYSLNHAHNRL